VEERNFPAIKTWFSYWSTDGANEFVFSQKGIRIDTGVPQELIDKVILWGQLCLPEYLVDTSPEFHRDLIAKFFSEHNEYTAAPRGFSKTTIIQLCLMFIIANRMKKFIVLIEKTLEEASEVIQTPRQEFEDNEMIGLIYGDIINSRFNKAKEGQAAVSDLGKKTRDTRADIFINGVRLRAKGFRSSPRGLKSRAHRPDLIVMDDVEEDEHIGSEPQRVKYMKQFNKGVQPAIDPTGSIKVFGTILHMDSLLNNLIQFHNGRIYRAWYEPTDAEWDWIQTPEIQVDNKRLKLLWSKRWSWELLTKKIQDMIGKNMSTSAAECEFRNNPVSDMDAAFKRKDLHREDRLIDIKEVTKKTNMNGYAMMDLADSTKNTADYTGAVTWLVDTDGNRYRVDVRRERRDILGCISMIFEIWEKWHRHGLIKIGIEKKAFEDQIVPLFKTECQKRNMYPVIEELRPMGRNKEGRIKGALQGLYQQGKIWTVGRFVDGINLYTKEPEKKFIPTGQTTQLLQELADFPNAAHDDLCFVAGTMIATPTGDRAIESLKEGDYVITPFGYRRIQASGSRGIKKVVKNHGLTGTPDHPIFLNGKFDSLDTEAYNIKVEPFTFNRFLTWRYKKLLSLMELPTVSWAGRKSIISLNQRLIKEGKVLKDFMLQFGSFTQERQFRKAMMFTISTAILLITTLIIWSAYRLGSIVRAICSKGIKTIPIVGNTDLKKREKQQKSGISHQKEEHGIGSMLKIIGRTLTLSVSIARNAMRRLVRTTETLDFAVGHAKLDHGGVGRERVYNINVAEDHVYYANGILVSNCDAEAYSADIVQIPFGNDAHTRRHIDPEDDPFASERDKLFGENLRDGDIIKGKEQSFDPY